MRDTLNAPWLLTNRQFQWTGNVIRNYHWLNSAQTGECKQFSMFYLDLWPTTLTYNPRLAKVKVDRHAKNQGQTVQTGECPQEMDGHTCTHTDATKCIISSAMRLIKTLGNAQSPAKKAKCIIQHQLTNLRGASDDRSLCSWSMRNTTASRGSSRLP